MSADRFYKVDLDFWHKRTCDRLICELGPWGACAWLALIAEAKRSRIPGTIIVTSEPDFWQLLGFYGEEHMLPPFTMDTFLTLTGRLKQTSRTRVGRLLHVSLTHYGEWQQDWRREADRHRQNSRRTRKNARDNGRDSERDASVTEVLGSSSSNPLPPFHDSRKAGKAAEAWVRNVGYTLVDDAPNDLQHELAERRHLEPETVARLVELAHTEADKRKATA